MSHEVITLQFGTYANFIGTHFWNAQDEYFGIYQADTNNVVSEFKDSVLFREGSSSGNQSVCTPRLVSFDVRSNWEGFNRELGVAIPSRPDEEYYHEQANKTWTSGNVDLFVSERAQANTFQKFLQDDSDQYEAAFDSIASNNTRSFDHSRPNALQWPFYDPTEEEHELETESSHLSDTNDFLLDDTIDNNNWIGFLKTRLHPRTVQHIGSVGDAGYFDSYAHGAALMRGTAVSELEFDSETAFEAARRWLEECDHLQGWQAIVDVDSAWGGFAVQYLKYVREETPKVPILTFAALSPEMARQNSPMSQSESGIGLSISQRQSLRSLNTGLAWANLVEESSLVVPLSVEAYASAMRCKEQTQSDMFWPFLEQMDFEKHYQSSAILSVAMDAWTSSFRRRTIPDSDRVQISTVSSDVAMQSDARVRSNHAVRPEYPHSNVEWSSQQPIAALPTCATMGDVISALVPQEWLKFAQLSATIPFAHPTASATALQSIFHKSPSVHEYGVSICTPLSFAGPLPASYFAQNGSINTQAKRPFSQQIVLRGALGPSTLTSVSRTLDNLVSRTNCGPRNASHAVMRDPIPLPLSIPRSLFRSSANNRRRGINLDLPNCANFDGYSRRGGVILNGVRVGFDGKPFTCRDDDTLGIQLQTVESMHQVADTGDNGGMLPRGLFAFPASVSVLVNAQVGPNAAPMVDYVYKQFQRARHDSSLIARLGTENYSGELVDGLSSTSESLASLYDGLSE